ncbi:solute carrier family 2, facilitated glucose transporter member 3-like [Ochlerotatus camptorhynchus]|uniref:solute carrier family 2, facilitated glucose transporter member 3-like n=1 Tax=Ochlerotatus camptorhynchus TaxID=644619 RepID=UPI0031E435C9
MDLMLPDAGWTTCLFMLAVTTTLGVSIPVGINIGVINAPSGYIKAWSNLTIFELYGTVLSPGSLDTFFSVVVSIFLIGGVVGSLGGAVIADKFGRKKSYLLCGILHTVGGFCFIFCRELKSVELLLLGRMLVGLAAGLTTGVLPMYLAEVSPTKLRGTISTLCGLGLTAGVVVGQIVSLDQVLGTKDSWQYGISCFTILNIFCYVPYAWLPESPKYLYSVKDDPDEALRAIRILFGQNAIGDDYVKLQRENAGTASISSNSEQNLKIALADSNPTTRSMWSVINDPTLRLPLILVCALQGGQQLSGINAVFYYSVSIFESVGLSSMSAKFANLGVGCLNLLVGALSPYLMAHFNRRTLCLISCSLCTLNMFGVAMVIHFIDLVSWFNYACIIVILLYIIFFQLGLGPIPFFIGSELFELCSRPSAMALGSLSSWGCNFLVGMFFPHLTNAWGAFAFLPCSVTCVLLTLLVLFYLPETRGRNVCDIMVLVSKGFKSKVV